VICAPSNEAADLILDRLHTGYEQVCTSVLRLNGVSRAEISVSSKIALGYSLPDGSGGFKFPDLKQLLEYRLVVCTLITSSKLLAVGVSDKHFTHLFIDEAGHTTV
jgi:helicase MOV-10